VRPALKLSLELAKWLNLNVRAIIDCASKVNDNNAAMLRKIEETLTPQDKYI